MIQLPSEAIIAIVVLVIGLVGILLALLVCCICRKCEQCAIWGRQKRLNRIEAGTERVIAESRVEFDQIRQQHDTVRDQLRVKYNLNNGNSNAAVLS